MLRRTFSFLAWPLLVVPQIIFWLGAFLNQLAMAVNGGVMPVLWNSMNKWEPDSGHVVMTHATHLKFLCDWINLHTDILSPGDLFLTVGDLLITPAFWIWLAYVVYCAYRHEETIQQLRLQSPVRSTQYGTRL